ncbi:exportin-2-like [Anopheles albimanus]|uniref:Exportin-2 n=1 Tax=Anopheles albimanus TaxID=7167 RepID=A0A182FVF8_ANOAL|nr:exportin-2-like [Anopheles albimanus]
MEINEHNFDRLANYLQQTLNPDPEVRRPAERFIESIEVTKNYPIVCLHLVGRSQTDMTIRVAAAIAFKNFIKRNWGYHLDNDGPDRVAESDRAGVKIHLVNLMLDSPAPVQKQLSDAVSIIGKYDFPLKWPEMIDQMIEKFAQGNPQAINGVLQTAHSLFKRYRYEFKSQTLWEEIKFVLDKIAKPLTDLLQATMLQAKEVANDVKVLHIIYESLVLICKVFFSLNSQDLPEFFEDNMETWMKAFHEMLTSDVPSLKTGDDEDAGILEQLRSQICQNLCMYAQKYDEEFGPYMPQFVTAVWELLVNTGIQTKYDSLVSYALHFLSTVADRSHYRHLFEDPNVLASICEKVIIPNMDFRVSDEELFEDNPEEYIRRDIEGSDVETRRRAACDLVKTLSQNFESKIIEIFGQYLQVLLAKYAEDTTNNWKLKDSAIYLVTSMASKGQTQKHGVTQTSELVPLPQFTQQHILTELERPDINQLPVLKADALKFIMTFRTILGPQIIVATMPLIAKHLTAGSVVVHTYAACAVDKILTMRGADKKPIVTKELLAPLSAELISGLFAAFTVQGSNENEYIMKCVMRVLNTLQEASLSFMFVVLPRLTEILAVVAKNPSKPHFNHYLFETLALSVKLVCKADPNAVSSFEEALFPVFQGILQQDVLEFMPYVFQMLSLFLEIREGKSAIPETYLSLFPCLLAPALWDRPGNVTPLIRLLSAFVRQASSHISADGKLSGVLGVFQKMIASKNNDHEGFYLMQNLLLHYPAEELGQSMRQIFSLLFQRLSSSKTTKFVRSFIVFLCLYAARVGPQALIQMIESIQAQMFGMVLERVFVPDINKVSGELEQKIVTVGITKLLCECQEMVSDPYVNYWPQLLQNLVQIFELPPDESAIDGDNFIEIEDVPGYQAAYSQLNFAHSKPIDPLPDVSNIRQYLVQNLGQLAQSQPGKVRTLVVALPAAHQEALQKYCAQSGVQIA